MASFEFALLGEQGSEVGARFEVSRIAVERFLVMRHGGGKPAIAHEGVGQVGIAADIVGAENQGLFEGRHGRFVVPFVREFFRDVEEAVELGCRSVDLQHAVRRNVHKLGNVHGAIGRGRILDQDGRAVVAVLVEVREKHLGVGRPDFEEKTSHRPLGEKLCHEFISGVLQRIRRAWPPSTGTM